MPKLATLADRQEYSGLLVKLSEQRMQQLAAKLDSGEMRVIDWQIAMREELRTANKMQLIAGAGGEKDAVNANDWLKLGSELQKQYRYVAQFARDIQAGTISPAQIAARSALYARSSQAVFWRQALPVKLPAYPRDGTSRCRSNCKCFWSVDYEYDADGKIVAVLATWNLDPDESAHCSDCPERSMKWNPLRIPVGYSFTDTPIKAEVMV